MNKRRLRLTRLALLIITGLAGPVFGQGTTGSIKGQLLDGSGAGVPGISVVAKNNRTNQSRSVTSNSDGRFQLQLAPGTYSLQSSGPGYTSITVEQVSVNIASTIDLRISILESTMDEVVVYGTARQLMASAIGESGLNITLEEVSRIPVTRSIEAVALMAPGTIPAIEDFGDDKRLVSFGGSSAAENVYYIDGLNVTDFRNGLGGSSVPFEFYGEFQIKTGGYSAEYGRSTGGVLNAVTRRGGNDFEFGVVTYFEPESMRGTSPNSIRADGTYYDFNSNNSESTVTTDIYVSGPLIKDRLFFFVLYEPQSSTTEYSERGSPDRWWKETIDDDFWGGNLNWNITDNHSFSYTAFTDQREIVGELYDYDIDENMLGDLVADSTKLRGGENQIISYQGQVTEKFVVKALYGLNKFNLSNWASSDTTCPSAVDASDSATAFRPGCEVSFTIDTDYDERQAYRLDVELVLGNHLLRAGFDREENTSFHASTYSGSSITPGLVGGAYYRYDSWDVGDQLANGAIVPDVNGDGSRVDTVRFGYADVGGTFDTISRAWYLEDEWEINDAFTLRLGIRNETFENYNGAGDTFFNIEDQWAPRLALNWSPGGTDKHRVTFNWGRYHLPIMAYPNIAQGPAVLDYFRYFVYDGNRDPTTAQPVAVDDEGVPTTQELGSILVRADGSVFDARGSIDTSLKPMYQDEWMIAYERDFGDDWVVGIRYVNREMQSLIEDVSTDAGLTALGYSVVNTPGQPCRFVMTNPGTDMTTFCDLDSDGILEETYIPADALGYPKPRRRYEAVEFNARKRFSNDWSLQGSYTWSKNLGNTEGTVKSDTAQADANLTTDFDWPQTMDGGYGYLPNDRRHKLKLWAMYQATKRLALSANLYAQSGRPINAFGIGHPDGTPMWGDTYYQTDQGDPNVLGDETFEFTPRGSQGRTDSTMQINLAAIYSFDWGKYADVELRAEVFNLLDADSATSVYEHLEEQPDQYKLPMTYQQPRHFRFGAAIRF